MENLHISKIIIVFHSSLEKKKLCQELIRICLIESPVMIFASQISYNSLLLVKALFQEIANVLIQMEISLQQIECHPLKSN